MRFARTTRILQGQWNAIPFLCVLFPLAFFLLFGSQLVLPPGVAIRLPAAGSDVQLDAATPRIIVALDAQGRLFLDNLYVPQDDIVRRLAERRQRLPIAPVVLIHADTAVAHGEVVRIGDLARQAGLERVFFVAQPPR